MGGSCPRRVGVGHAARPASQCHNGRPQPQGRQAPGGENEQCSARNRRWSRRGQTSVLSFPLATEVFPRYIPACAPRSEAQWLRRDGPLTTRKRCSFRVRRPVRFQGGRAMSPQPFQREVRLGLVLYGGVSLAVYMNGVANEFFDVVKGRGPYKLLKALTASDVGVDIGSGTSAGGINGVLLSYALSNDRAFGTCRSFWREAADIESLLREPSSPPPRSLLRGETYFQDQLETI